MASISSLLALEIERILADLEERRALLVELWSMHRSRWPQAEASFSRWRTLRSPQLDSLPAEVVVRIDDFYAALEDWLDYVRTTEDMPLHLDWNWRQHQARLVATGRRALEVLDAAPKTTVPEVDRDGRSFLEAFALRRPLRGPASSPRSALNPVEE